MSACFNVVNKEGDFCTWHSRLGHASSEVLYHIAKIPVDYNGHDCLICHIAIQCRTVFPSSSIKTSRILQLLHIDLW